MIKAKARRGGASSRSWPQWAIVGFIALLVLVYTLIFTTGEKTLSPKLGIDLQGGTRVTLVPQGQEPTKDQLDQARMILENRVNGMGVSGAEVISDGNSLVITVPGSSGQEARQLGQTTKMNFRPVQQLSDVDLEKVNQATTDMANRWVKTGILTPEEANTRLKEAHEQWILSQKAQRDQLAQQGLDPSAMPEVDFGKVPTVTEKAPEEPANSIVAAERRAAALDEAKASRQSEDHTTMYAAMGLMRCGGEGDEDTLDPLAGNDDPAKPLLACDTSDGVAKFLGAVPPLVGQENEKDPQRLTGESIDTGSPISGGLNTQTGEMEIVFKFKTSDANKGGETWSKLTQDMVGQQVAITLDSQIISAPTIQEPTPAGQATRITGSFTQEEAQSLANNLRYGALPLSFAGENGETGGTVTSIPPSLGAASLEAGLIAGAVGLALVAVFILWYARAFGLLALVSLAGAGAMVFGVLVLLGRWIGYSLDLAGIAGIIIGIGTTADSFVVYFERVKDEVRNGRTIRSAVPRAWERSRRTIWSGNFVSLIAAVVLYILAIGDVRGFAFTLGLTTIFDLVTAFLVTAPLVILASRKPALQKPALTGLGSVMKVAQQRRAEESAAEPVAAGKEN
ncbi:protein translocase subunit SecD [Corynebacterium ulceribovis]|uniref:protein translocase subunit SecD n=1 Tax=Corynebacterium ulceribovis TaxID=487732 RepID=UPI00036F9C5F|nr:protein translocase subunit SecD [Corynebacterium ulceribovis]